MRSSEQTTMSPLFSYFRVLEKFFVVAWFFLWPLTVSPYLQPKERITLQHHKFLPYNVDASTPSFALSDVATTVHSATLIGGKLGVHDTSCVSRSIGIIIIIPSSIIVIILLSLVVLITDGVSDVF
ncbi:uncharacterized protein RJT20DRAFT_129526 [Scheffersomyces xylosifermentans]|uniref:uncharacterized protein n=1 Tax=Scheffersomyces xylosifermentans TaxID=1304137 RepID=UPI00315D189E